jgi:hypothetical protein
MGRIVLVGDVGGFPGELARVVGEGGDLVIQVGDLVDRGPDSPGVLALVRERLERDRRGWVQLIGNHEWQYLDGERVRRRAVVDWAARHTITRVSGGARFIGIDPRHGRTGAPQWAPLVLDGATLVA